MILARSVVGASGKKELGWAAGGFVLVAVMSGILGFMQTRSSDERWGAGDQSLDSLDALPLADRSGAVPMPGAAKKGSKGADWTNPESMLYQAPGGTPGEVTASNENAADKLSEDLGRANSIGKKPADPSGWGGEAARTGISAASNGGARPTLAPMGGSLGGSSGGNSGASFSGGGSAPFGVGQSHPGQAQINGAPSSSAGVVRGGSQSLLALRQVANAMGNARVSHDMERSWGHGAGSFDGAGTGGTLSGGGTSVEGIGTGSGVPANLKDGDPNGQDLLKKDIQPAPPPTPTPTSGSSIQNQELMMMAAGLLAAGLVAVLVKQLTSKSTDATSGAGQPPPVPNGCIDPKTCTPGSGKG